MVELMFGLLFGIAGFVNSISLASSNNPLLALLTAGGCILAIIPSFFFPLTVGMTLNGIGLGALVGIFVALFTGAFVMLLPMIVLFVVAQGLGIFIAVASGLG